MSKLAELIADAPVCPHCGSAIPSATKNEKRVCRCRQPEDSRRKAIAFDEDSDWSNVT